MKYTVTAHKRKDLFNTSSLTEAKKKCVQNYLNITVENGETDTMRRRIIIFNRPTGPVFTIQKKR